MTTIEPYISVRDVQKIYYPSPPWMKALVRTNIREPVVAIDNVTFDVQPGEIVAIVGPNGAGKTTAFRVLVGLTTPTSGTAQIMGFDTTREAKEVRALVGWMPGDDRSLLMRLSCTENLRFHGRMQGMTPKAMSRRIPETLELVGLGHAAQKSIFALSAGMRARMQLARAILHKPKVLILDEPTGTVDPVAAHVLLNLIIEIVAEEQIAALVSSHRLEEIEALHSRVLLLDQGAVRYDGSLDELRTILDRPCIELEFDTSDRAFVARDLARVPFPDSDISVIDDTTLRCVFARSATPGEFLDAIAPVIGSVVHLREIQRPLREMLAEIYLGPEATLQETS